MLYIIFKMPDVCKSATYWRRAVVPPSSSYLITHKISDTKKNTILLYTFGTIRDDTNQNQDQGNTFVLPIICYSYFS